MERMVEVVVQNLVEVLRFAEVDLAEGKVDTAFAQVVGSC